MTDLKNYEKANLRTYQQLIGKLMYLICSIRSDITFAVRQLSKYNADLRKRYLQTVKRVVGYLKDTMNIGLIFD